MIFRALALVLLLSIPTSASAAAFAITELFNYSNGDLNGQSGGSGWGGAWSGSANYDIQSTEFIPGSDIHTAVINTTQAEVTISRAMAATADSGDFYFSIKRTDTGDALCTGLDQSGTNAFYICWNNGSGSIDLEGVSTVDIVVSPTIGEWYDINVNFVTSSTIRARAKLSSSSTWGSWSTTVTLRNSHTGVDLVKLDWGSAAGNNNEFYWARFQSTDPSAEEGGGGGATSTAATTTVPYYAMHSETFTALWYVLSIAMAAYFGLLVFRFFAG